MYAHYGRIAPSLHRESTDSLMIARVYNELCIHHQREHIFRNGAAANILCAQINMSVLPKYIL